MTLGVLVMAYGTPATPADIEPYYTHIRRGRPPTPELLAELTARYEALGGVSPLAERTEAQRAAIEAALPAGTPVHLGQKHAAPFVEDGLAELADAGADVVVGLVLAPHFSMFSVGQYHERAAATAEERGVDYRPIDDWSDLEPWLDFQAAAVTEQLAGLPDDTTVLFTAHSLPERALEGDRYPEYLAASASAIAERVGLDGGDIGWQSAGRTPEPWRGPDILEVIDGLGTAGLLVCAQGFTSDHLEILYDLDIEARTRAEGRGITFARTRSVNDDPAVMAGLAGLVMELA
ncbi:MAG TPA: ferrochelatase [Acidimicrobiales bacterium]